MSTAQSPARLSPLHHTHLAMDARMSDVGGSHGAKGQTGPKGEQERKFRVNASHFSLLPVNASTYETLLFFLIYNHTIVDDLDRQSHLIFIIYY